MMKRFLPLLILTGLLFGQVDIEWSKTYGEELTERGRFVQQTNDGGFAILGWKENYQGITDAWLIKTNGIGDTLWTKTYGGLNNVQAYAVKQTVDGGYIIIGTKYYDSQDLWLIKTNENGDSLWSKTYGGESTEQGRSVIETDDGGFLLFGSTRSYTDSYRNFWLIKTSSNGDSLWSKTYGGINDEFSSSIIDIGGSGYLIVGQTLSTGNGSSDLWLIQIDENGDSLWSKTYGGEGWDYPYHAEKTSDNGCIIVGGYDSDNDSPDIWSLKIAPITINNINQMDFPKEYVLNQNYPNPFNPITTLRYDLPENSYVNVTVYDILGREVRTLVKTTQDAGYRSVIWDATNDYGKPVSAGVYLYQIQAGGFVQTKKMVLLK